MRRTRFTLGRATDPAAQGMLTASRNSRPKRLAPRELAIELLFGGGVLAASAAIAVGFDSPRESQLGLTLARIVALAIASRVRFAVGAGFTTPAQLVFIPMLVFLPPAVIPVAVGLGYALAKLPDALSGKLQPDRLIVSLGDAFFAIGPALVIAI